MIHDVHAFIVMYTMYSFMLVLIDEYEISSIGQR